MRNSKVTAHQILKYTAIVPYIAGQYVSIFGMTFGHWSLHLIAKLAVRSRTYSELYASGKSDNMSNEDRAIKAFIRRYKRSGHIIKDGRYYSLTPLGRRCYNQLLKFIRDNYPDA